MSTKQHIDRRVLLSGAAAVGAAASVSALAAEATRPNILVILADDMGFADPGYMGGDIRTPNLDSLAQNGALFTQFYNEAKCSPTRAAFLSGRSSRFVIARSEGKLTEDEDLAPGVPTVAEHIRKAGYRTYLSGKWHLGDEPAQWPIERGFDEAFGLITGASSYFEMRMREAQDNPATAGQWPHRPFMVDGRQRWEPPKQGFYMTSAITDRAVQMVKAHAERPQKQPFFMYLAYTSPHWPLHALPEDIAEYDGHFTEGWEVTRRRRLETMKARGLLPSFTEPAPLPETIPTWNAVSDKASWSRRMQVYAAQISRMDKGIGQVLEALKRSGQYQNTLIVFLSDNGATKESMAANFGYNDPKAEIGSARTNTSYQEPWAAVSNTPLRSYKRYLYEGGIRTSMVAHWPAGLKQKGRRSDMVGHVTDLAPTFLALAGSSTVMGSGLNLASWIRRSRSPQPRTLFWSFNDECAARHGGWKAVRSGKDGAWSLFNIDIDAGETHDLSAEKKQMVQHLEQAWLDWASKT